MKRFRFPVLALAMFIAMLAAFAFNVKPGPAKRVVTTYYYVGGNSLSAVKTPSNWVENDDPCEPTGSIPCSLDFEGMNRAAFDAHIATYTSVSQAANECTTKRSQ